jgi:hypothetical protein
MVNFTSLLCDLFGRKCKAASKEAEVAELVRLLKNLIPIAERELDGRLEIDGLKRRLGINRAYAGVA